MLRCSSCKCRGNKMEGNKGKANRYKIRTVSNKVSKASNNNT